MKKIILTTTAIAFSILTYAQTDGKSSSESATPASQPPPRTINPNQSTQQTGTVTPEPRPTPPPQPPAKPMKPKQNAPVSSPPPVKPAPMLGSPRPEEGHDNGQHKDHGKHNGEIKHDHEKNDHEHKDSLKTKKKED